jgi:hypothetical protein
VGYYLPQKTDISPRLCAPARKNKKHSTQTRILKKPYPETDEKNSPTLPPHKREADAATGCDRKIQGAK